MFSIATLRTFVCVAETGGIRRAAERLGRTPSAVSTALKQLEDGVGTALFERDRKIHLTKVGAFTLEAARDILKHYDNSCAGILSFARDEISRCTVASVTSFAGTVLPEAILRVKKRSKNFEVVLREVHSARMAAMVADGLVDVGFGRIGVTHPDVEATPLLHDRYSVVCRFDHRFTGLKRPITWQDVEEEDFISNESYDSSICEGLRQAHARARSHVSSASSAFALVTASVGVTVMPQLAVRVAPVRVCFLPLSDPEAFRVVAVLIRRGKKLTPAAQMLIETTRTLLSETAVDLNVKEIGLD